MPITPKLCITYEADGSQITVKDVTKEYNAQTNTGGYGTPNADRNTLAGVLLAYYQPYESEKSLLLSVENAIKYNAGYLNTEESSFIFPYFKDGWYQYIYTLVPTSTLTPEEGFIIYDTNVDQLRQYNASLELVPVFDYTVLSNSLLYASVTVDELIPTKLGIKKGQIMKEYFACKTCKECDCEEEFKMLLDIKEGISSSLAQFEIAKFEAQRMIERLTKQYKT